MRLNALVTYPELVRLPLRSNEQVFQLCFELQATVNPKNNLAHSFCCSENTNNIDLMMLQGHDFLGTVSLLESWH